MQVELPAAIMADISDLRKRYGAGSMSIRPEGLPEELREASGLLAALAVSDDGVRDALCEMICAHPEGGAVDRAIEPYLKRMCDWLFDPNGQSEWTEERDAATCVYMLLDLRRVHRQVALRDRTQRPLPAGRRR